MFDKDKCKRCGTCLMLCPFLAMPKDQAEREIQLLVEKASSDSILEHCAGCSYCDAICPTQSNPSELRKEIKRAHNRERGVSGLLIMSEEVPLNLMSAGLESDKDEKQARLAILTNPEPHEEVFYLGCSLSYIYTDLAKTGLLDELPVIGGMKYCCGGYANILFGEEEARIKGRQLLAELKKLGIKRMVSFCPECDNMLKNVYPALIEEFDIQTISIVDYLLERQQGGHLRFVHPIPAKVTVHDPCSWRKLGPQSHESPRQLLQAMGAEVVEMQHARSKSLCCGLPLLGQDYGLAMHIAEKRVLEAKETGADTIVVSCTGCFFLSDKAAQHGLDVFHTTELVQVAIGENPPHRIGEINACMAETIMTIMQNNPELMQRKYIIDNGAVRPV